ncbi:Multifunctional cytochrome P450 monooxygenase af510 [Paramyrothecium foliicola]|nr:Multifunctional cytochrome P450 monooxygenase af510 [Paramyrothecium foliicola]
MITPSVSLLAVAVIGSLIYYIFFAKQKHTRLPPGPAPWPVIGNLPDLPSPVGPPEYLHWVQHKDKYGRLSSMQVMGQTLLIIHDHEIARDLFDKRSKFTTGRPFLEFAHGLAGYGGYTTGQGRNDNFKRQRRFMHQTLGTKGLVDQYSSIQRAEVGYMLSRVLEEPRNLVKHFQKKGTDKDDFSEAGAIILNMTYGYSVEKKTTDPLVRLVDQMMANFALAFRPLAWPVDAFPVLKYLPSWLPGASFKQTASKWNQINQLVANIPYAFTKESMNAPGYQRSMVSRVLEEGQKSGKFDSQDEESLKWAAATLYGGGADTTVSSLTSFVLAMIKFPEVQRKAQEEIDRVIGSGRLPQFEDRDKLPYVNAVAKETFRWFPVAPLGVPHTVDEDFEYDAYVIPKGAMLIPNIWWLLHDPEVFKDPEAFDPTRYISPRNEPDPTDYCFGFGRRICPGRHVADASVFLSVAQLLCCFNLDKALDGNGKPIEPELRAGAGLVIHPHEFPYQITPRSPTHQDLIKNAGNESRLQPGDSSKIQGLSAIDEVLS